MSDARVEVFSLSHAEILDGSKSFRETLAVQAAVGADIYGVSSGNIEPDVGDYENEGDDSIMSYWAWINSAEVSVEAGFVSLPLIANLTGQTIESSGSGATQSHEIDLWHEDSMNVPPRPMVVKMPSKDATGAVRFAAIGLYKVFFRPITFNGPEYKNGMKVTYGGRALLSETDEKGQPFADGKKRVARFLSYV